MVNKDEHMRNVHRLSLVATSVSQLMIEINV